MWQVPAEVPGESEEQRDKRLKAALLLRFQMEARRKQERRMAGEGPADQLPGDVLQDEEEGEEEDSAAANNFLDKRWPHGASRQGHGKGGGGLLTATCVSVGVQEQGGGGGGAGGQEAEGEEWGGSTGPRHVCRGRARAAAAGVGPT